MLTANAEDYKLSFGALSVNSDNYTKTFTITPVFPTGYDKVDNWFVTLVNGKEITDPSQLSISFTKATGIFTGKAKVYFDYEVCNYKNGEEIWTKQHKDAALPYSGVMIYDGDGDYYGYGSAVHTFKYTDYDENDKKTTVTKKVTLPVSLERLEQ